MKIIPTRLASLIARFRLVPALGVVAVTAIAVRLTVRDRLPVLSTFYYATPYPVLLLACTSMALLLSLRRQWKAAAVALGLGLVSGGFYVGTSYVSSDGSTGNADLKVLFWNAARGKAGASQVMAHAVRADADLIGLVETGGKRVASHEEWKRTFPDIRCRRSGEECVSSFAAKYWNRAT